MVMQEMAMLANLIAAYFNEGLDLESFRPWFPKSAANDLDAALFMLGPDAYREYVWRAREEAASEPSPYRASLGWPIKRIPAKVIPIRRWKA